MSHILLPLIDCPNLQTTLNQITDKGGMPGEAAPEIQFLTSPQNTNRVLETNVSPGSGKVRTVEVVYTPRGTEEEADTTLTTDCASTNEAGMLSESYTIDENAGVQVDEKISFADLTRICKSNPEFVASRIAALLDLARRKMQTGVAEQMALLHGKFAVDNGETGLSDLNRLKTVATKYPAASKATWNPEALQEIVFSSMNSGFTGIPYVFGFGEIWRYWNYLIGLGNSSDGGMDFASYVNQNQAAFMPSIKTHKALNGADGSGSKFLVVDTGSLFLLQYNRFEDSAQKVNDGFHVQDIIVDPLTGVPFNYKVTRTCDETISFFISTAYKVVGLPNDMYSGGDRLDGTNGVLQFQITNS